MRRVSLLATLALCVISALAGGAIVRLVGLTTSPAAMATVLFVAGVVVVGLGGGRSARPSGGTPYWR